jgi:hypothetical protein
MELNKIDEDWYSHDDTSLLKKIMEQQEKQIGLLLSINQSLEQLSGRMSTLEIDNHHSIEHISTRITKLDEKIKESDISKIKKSLEELSVLKEREINALLREHIPFPFSVKHNSPLANIPFRRPFSKPKE